MIVVFTVGNWCRETDRTYTWRFYHVFPGLLNDLASNPVSLVLAGLGGLLVLTGIVASIRSRWAAARHRDDPDLADAPVFRRYAAAARVTLLLSVLLLLGALVATAMLQGTGPATEKMEDWSKPFGGLHEATLPALRITIAFAMLGYVVGSVVLASLRELRRGSTILPPPSRRQP
jgi:hypothetical protein